MKPTNNSQKKEMPGAGRFDPVNSTYKHEIYLQNGKRLTGYSKGLLVSEMQDKIVLLERVILRLVNKGYLDPARTNRIEFYKKSFLENNDELILTLYPADYSMQPVPQFVMSERLLKFLVTLYKQIKERSIVFKDIMHKPIRVPEENLFSLDYKRFKNVSELQAFIIQQAKNNVPEGLLTNFFLKYSKKYLSESY